MFVPQYNGRFFVHFIVPCWFLLDFGGYNINFCVSEYKRAKQDLKKATTETNKWQKKVKKGELGEHNKNLHLKINLIYLMHDPTSCLCYIPNATNHPFIKSLKTNLLLLLAL